MQKHMRQKSMTKKLISSQMLCVLGGMLIGCGQQPAPLSNAPATNSATGGQATPTRSGTTASNAETTPVASATADTSVSANGDTSVAPAMSTASLSQGLERLLRRPSSDGWALAISSRYMRQRSPQTDFIQRLKAGLVQAQTSRVPGQMEWPYDSDENGQPDFWYYFENDRVAFIEADRLGTWVHDLRIDTRTQPWQTGTTERWLITPPIPLPNLEPQRLGVIDVWDAAVRRAGRRNVPALEPLVRRELANFDAEIERLAAKSDAQQVGAGLVELERRSLELLPRFQQIHRNEGYAKKLVATVSKGHPYDLDGKPGDELLVFFETTGVTQFRFYERDFHTEKAPVSECVLQDGQVVWIKFGGRTYFGTQGFWLRLHPEVRRNIVRGCFRTGFEAFRSRRWYAATSAWMQGRVLAAATEDVHSNAQARIATDFPSHQAAAWSSSSDDLPTTRLIELGLNFTALSCPTDLSELGEHMARQGLPLDGLALLDVCLKFTDKCQEPRSKVSTLESMSRVQQRIGHYDRAIASLFQSLDLEGSVEYAASMSERIRSLSESDTGANLSVGRALTAHSMTVNRAAKLASIAMLYFDLGDHDRAETYATEAERLFVQAEHVYGLADIANLRGRLDLTRGAWRLAFNRLRQSLQLQQTHAAKIDEHRRQDAKRDPVGGESQRLNHAEHQQSLPISPEEYVVVVMLAGSHPLSYHALTASLLGEACLQGALELEATSANEAAALREDAAKWQNQALAWYREAKDNVGEPVTRLRQAELAWHNHDYQAVQQLAKAAMDAADQQQLFEVGWRALLWQGLACRAQQQTLKAERSLLAAVERIESLRAALRSESVRSGFFGSKLRVYEELIDLCVARGDSEQAWQWIERAKARSLLDLLSGEAVAPKGAAATEVRRQQPQLFTFRAPRSLGNEPPDAQQVERQQDRLLELFTDRPQLQEVASLATVQPASLAALQTLLDEHTLLLEYFETERQLFVATISTGGIHVQRIPGYGRQRLHDDVATFRELLQNPQTDRYTVLAQELYSRLVRPAIGKHQDVKRLCIVPAAALHYLPFQTLMPDSQTFLLMQSEVSYAPSASALVYARHRRVNARETVHSSGPVNEQSIGTLIVANPRAPLDYAPLPFAAIEGRRIQSLSGASELLEAEAATESDVVTRLAQARCFHFAGHTHFVPSTPLRTALLCTPDEGHDGKLEVGEFLGLDLRHCELAVLSACETQLGRLSSGDELVGLSRAFLRAGVPTVVSSLWKVPDEPTTRLMVRFHELRQRQGLSKRAALMQAQREFLSGDLTELQLTTSEQTLLKGQSVDGLLAQSRGARVSQRHPAPASRPHPYYWAAFCLTGDWQ